MNSADPRSEHNLSDEPRWTLGQLRDAEPAALPSEDDLSWAVLGEPSGEESDHLPASEPAHQTLDIEAPVLTFQFPPDLNSESPSATPPQAVRRTSRRTERRRKERHHAPKALLAVMVLAAMTTLMFVLLRPDLLFSRSTPTGGDNAVHIWAGDYLKRVLIPHGRLFGWSNDSFAGLPVLSFYFPLPTWLIVGLSYLIPYTIAFKLVTVVGVLLLPWACFRLGRRAELAWPEPLFLAAGSFPFLLLRHYKILGGNLFSTMAGEFSFSLSLLLTVFYMGSLIRLLRTGRGRTRTMAVLAGVGLCHIVPSIFAIGFTVACALFELRRSLWKRQLRDVATVSVVAGMLTAFWTVPFAHNLPYTNSMDYERNTRTLRTLFPLLPHSATLHTPADGTTQASVFVVLMFVAIWVGLRRRDPGHGRLGVDGRGPRRACALARRRDADHGQSRLRLRPGLGGQGRHRRGLRQAVRRGRSDAHPAPHARLSGGPYQAV